MVRDFITHFVQLFVNWIYSFHTTL